MKLFRDKSPSWLDVVPWAVWVGIWQFLVQQDQSNKQEFRKKQLELCVQATDAAARLSPGRAEQHGFEYYRHSAVSLYAALYTATGDIIGQTSPVTPAQRLSQVQQPLNFQPFLLHPGNCVSEG